MKINERFRTVAPPLSDNEYELLKADILEHGCRDPLVTWNGFIVDGHHRYKICSEYGIPFESVEMNFSGEDEALIWIARNQLGRRNLNAFQRCELVLPLEDALKAEAERRRRAGISLYRTTGETNRGEKTRDILASMAGVSHALLRQVKAILENADEETKAALRKGELKVNAVYTRIAMADTQKSRRDREDSAVTAIRELLRKVTYGEADPGMVVMELTRILEMMGAGDGKESV